MEGYSMFKDGHVLDVKVSKCENDKNEILLKYVAISSNVKPRTRDKDPVTKKAYYTTWIITTSADDFQGGSIYSAFCSCKGGADGSCRHVIATLFEVVNFLNDRQTQSVTSGACQWVRRAREVEVPTLVTDLDTSLEATLQSRAERPTEDIYTPISEDAGLPNPERFIERLKRAYPESCMLDVFEVRPKTQKQISEHLSVKTPLEKAEDFFSAHTDCRSCTDNCLLEFQEKLGYDKEERASIELQTRGQHNNENWFNMRKGLLTASRFKDILHSTNLQNTAESLLKESGLNEEFLPEPLAYGRKNETKAREMFVKSHKYKHKKCSILIPGLTISQSNCFLAASPDGIMTCERCGKFLVEVKCFWKYKGFHPKNALIMSKVCRKSDNGELIMEKSHKYYYQIQGQMLCAGIYKYVLVAYTNRGIEPLDVPFDAEFCQINEQKLSKFYINVFYNTLKKRYSHVTQQESLDTN